MNYIYKFAKKTQKSITTMDLVKLAGCALNNPSIEANIIDWIEKFGIKTKVSIEKLVEFSIDRYILGLNGKKNKHTLLSLLVDRGLLTMELEEPFKITDKLVKDGKIYELMYVKDDDFSVYLYDPNVKKLRQVGYYEQTLKDCLMKASIILVAEGYRGQ